MQHVSPGAWARGTPIVTGLSMIGDGVLAAFGPAAQGADAGVSSGSGLAALVACANAAPSAEFARPAPSTPVLAASRCSWKKTPR